MAAWKMEWGTQLPSSHAAWKLLRSCSRLQISPAEPVPSCSSFSFFFCYLQSSPGIMSTLSRVIHNYIRCHLLERTVTCRTNLYSTSHVPNYLKKKNKKTNINHAYREFLILLGPSRDKKGPLREHLFHLFGLIWPPQQACVVGIILLLKGEEMKARGNFK